MQSVPLRGSAWLNHALPRYGTGFCGKVVLDLTPVQLKAQLNT